MATYKKSDQDSAPKKLHRISGSDSLSLDELFKTAMLLLVPEDQKQREAFIPLMPYLYVMRRKGCSWIQLTNLLTLGGFKLLVSTVRTYYNEELALRQDLCEARLTETLLAIAATRKAAIGEDQAAIAERVATGAAKQKAAAAVKLDAIFGTSGAGAKNPAGAAPPGAAKLDAVFGSGGAGAPQPLAPPSEAVPVVQVAALPQPVENKKTGLRPATSGQSPIADELKTKDVFNSQSSQDDPAIPVLKQKIAAAPPPAPANANTTALPPQLVCQKLQDGVAPLEKRDTVAFEIYQPGNLEHPAIPGLLLTLDQRLYGARLEYADVSDGDIKLESVNQKRFRITWTKPIPMTASSTGGNFTKMNAALGMRKLV